jgi:uncharacterized protein (DUF1684 family)
MPSSAYADEIQAWRQGKDEPLRRRDGWLALAGLHWLEPGSHTAGSSAEVDILLPASVPARLGALEVRHGQVFFRRDASLSSPFPAEPADGAALQNDAAEKPDFLRVGAVTLVVIQRADRVGLRVWDNDRPQRLSFPGRSWFPVETAWSVTASFETTAAGQTIRVPNQVGGLTDEPLLGMAAFTIAGQSARLQAVPAEDGRLWFLFGDATNGDTTYPAGRFLVADHAQAGRLTLDFNRAYNPPCAFTPYATCPLPPPGNQLAMRIEAGERFAKAEVPHASPGV